jgi:2-iminobutanoate/2-iminopropanoate deaminase
MMAEDNMSAKTVSTVEAPAAIGPYSQGVQTGKMLFCSGQLGLDPESGALASDDVERQADRCLRNIAAILKSAGFAMTDVVKTTVFITEMGNFETVNRVYSAHFGTHKPARSTVAVKALPRGALVEIEAIASRD